MGRRCRLVVFLALMSPLIGAQSMSSVRLCSFAPSDTFHKTRFWTATAATGVLYTGTVITLNSAWYKQFPRTHFHFFDDHREWHGMDKTGHLYTAYFESLWAYEIARWTGIRENPAIWTGAALGMLFQTTVEVLDGFSSKWGFSLSDASFNVLGSGAFVVQQKAWGEQRIVFKVSSTPITYPALTIPSQNGNANTTLRDRTEDLFGTHYAERFLKDYNAQTTWLSVNVHAFLRNPDSKFPRWLNIAFGYGAENMFGGFINSWDDGNGSVYTLPEAAFPRYSQYYLSPDIDFSRIPSKSPFVRTLLGVLNVFKVPGPVLEYNRVEGLEVKLRW